MTVHAQLLLNGSVKKHQTTVLFLEDLLLVTSVETFREKLLNTSMAAYVYILGFCLVFIAVF